MAIVIFIVMLLVLVLVHEAGHFFTAKAFKIRVDEFGFGFPPKLFGIKKGETEYSINAIPFGGFVKIFGESPDEESLTGPDANRSLVNKPKYQQALVMVAGICANFLLAWLLLSFGFISGLPTSLGSEPSGYKLQNVNLVVVSVAKKSPAAISGLKSGDKIISVQSDKDSIVNLNPDSLKAFVLSHPKKEINIGYLRGKDITEHLINVLPVVEKNETIPSIGVAIDQIGTLKLPIFRAFYEGMKSDVSVTKQTVVGLYALITDSFKGKANLSAVAGPVGMIGIVGDASKFGFAYLLSFAALISVNLAIINLIPFPALDGGRLLFLLIEKIKGSRMNEKFANMANMIGFSILILLMLVISFHDILKLFK